MSSNRSGELFAETSHPSGGKMMVAHIDGGSRGNPGPAGYGAYITDADGHRLAELNDFLGVQTNNFAEYSGLIAALEYAVEHGYARVQVISDSELLVKQMKGIYKVRSEALLSIYAEAKALVRKVERFEIRHVLRHLNKDADRLANEAMDRGMKRAQQPRVGSAPTLGHQANAYAKPPLSREEVKELRGFVSDGRVEFTGERFPDGVFVVIRRARD